MSAPRSRRTWAVVVAGFFLVGALGSLSDGNLGGALAGFVVAGACVLVYTRSGAGTDRPRRALKDFTIVVMPSTGATSFTTHTDRAVVGEEDAAATPLLAETGPAHVPARPRGAATSPWAAEQLRTEVVGETYSEDAIRTLYGAHERRLTVEGEELTDVTAQVVTDTRNPFDPNAVAVWVEGQHVGFLSREDAAQYAGPLGDLADQGAHLEVPARVWARLQGDAGPRRRGEPNRQISSRVTVRLPPPTGVLPFNALPDEPHTVIPAGGSIQVTGEEDHMETLMRYVGDVPRHLAVTLHLVEEASTPRSKAYEAVEVRLDGQRVGVLTRHMSEQLRDLVAHVAGRGRLAVCRAVLVGSPLRAEMTLKVCRSTEVTKAWLEAVPLAG
ncbi:MAG TPA: hypothetical protein VFM07_10305 [Intrasporangium sp.]|nr:hypothetical protein [Intrasporangium sp.]